MTTVQGSVKPLPIRPRRRKWLRRAAFALPVMVVGLVYVVLPILAAIVVGRATTRPADRNLTSTPKDLGADYKDVEFQTSDGVRLSGWLLPSGGRRATLVFAHGLFRSRHELLERAVDLWREGYGALLYDARNHGKSGPARVTLGYNERLDIEAAIRFTATERPSDSIVLFGISMGGAAALLAAAETPVVAAVIADSSYLSFADTSAHHIRLLHLPAFPLAHEVRALIAWRGGFDSAALDPLGAVRKLGARPALFIAAAHDPRMPPEIARQLYEASASPQRKVLVIDGPEADIHAHAYQSDPKRYIAEVVAFLNEAIP